MTEFFSDDVLNLDFDKFRIVSFSQQILELLYLGAAAGWIHNKTHQDGEKKFEPKMFGFRFCPELRSFGPEDAFDQNFEMQIVAKSWFLFRLF